MGGTRSGYGTMRDQVRWRKQVGRKETLALNDDVLHERAGSSPSRGQH